MRKLIYGMNLTLDGYIAAAGHNIGWSGPPSGELFQWWLDQQRASGLSLYGRELWETMSAAVSHGFDLNWCILRQIPDLDGRARPLSRGGTL